MTVAETSLLVVERVNDVTVARLARPLHLSGAPAEAVGGQLARLAEGGGGLLVNLANAEILTSLMLSKLLAVYKALDAAGGRFALCAPTPAVREILDVTRLT